MVRHKQNPLESGQYNYLQHADDNSFTSLARSYGLAVEGPSKHGSYLTKDSDGRILLWSAMRKHGRTYVPSVWTDLNVSVMRQENQSNPLGHGHWESFDSENAAKQYARLMEGQGRVLQGMGRT